MKKILLIIVLLGVLLLNPYTLNRLILPILRTPAQEQGMQEPAIEYRPDRYVGSQGKYIIYYDGRNLRKFDENGKMLYEATIRSDNFNVDVGKNLVFLLDKVQKKIYVINAAGEIVAQTTLDKDPKSIKAVSGDKVTVRYLTDVKVEGIQLYDSSGKLLEDLNYPKRGISFLEEDPQSGGLLLSSLVKDTQGLRNSIYIYNGKMELQVATDVEDSVFIKSLVTKDRIYLMDTSYIAVYNREFVPQYRITTQGNLYDFAVTSKGLYTIDSSNRYTSYDLEGNLIEETSHKEPLLFLRVYKDMPVLVLKGSYQVGGETYDLTKDIVDLLPMDNRLAIVFKDSIKFVKVLANDQ